MFTYVITQKGYNEDEEVPYLVLHVWIVKAKSFHKAHALVKPELEVFPHDEDTKIETACINSEFAWFEGESIVWSSKPI